MMNRRCGLSFSALLALFVASTGTVYAASPSGSVQVTITIQITAVDHYEITATSPRTAGTGWTETITAVDGSGGLLPVNRLVTLSSSGNAVFYTDGTYTTPTGTVMLVAGTATLFVKDNTAETITLTGTDGIGKTGTSGNIVVNPAAPASLAFLVEPGDGREREPLPVQPVIGVVDAYGNKTAATGITVTIGIQNNPGGASLSGTTTRTSAAGQVSFTDLAVNNSGTGYTLRATAGGLTAATSTPFNVAEVNRAPRILSDPTATPNPATVGEAVVFSCAAVDADGDALTWSWDFGNGATGTGEETTYAYGAAGTYLVRVTVGDGKTTVSANLTVVVVDGGARPIGKPLMLRQLRLAVRFNKEDRDRMWMRGQLQTAEGFDPDGALVVLDFGGNVREFTLNSRGTTSRGLLGAFALRWKKRQPRWIQPGWTEFRVRLRRENLSAQLADEGVLSEDVKDKDVTLGVAVTLDGTDYIGEIDCRYRARIGKTGRAREKRR